MKKLALTLILCLSLIPSIYAFNIVWRYLYSYEDPDSQYDLTYYAFDVAKKNSFYYTIRNEIDTATYNWKIILTRMNESGAFISKSSILAPDYKIYGSYVPYKRCLLSIENSGKVLSVINYDDIASFDYKIFRHNANLSGTPVLIASENSTSYIYTVDYIVKDGTNFIVSGERKLPSGNQDIFIREYDSTGLLLWEKIISPIGVNLKADLKDFILNGADIYVAGSIDTSVNIPQFFISKINKTTGVTQWLFKRKNISQKTVCNNIAIGALGDVYGCGSRSTIADNDNRWLTLKINSSGVEQWNKLYNNIDTSLYSPSNDIAYTLKLDTNENVYVAGCITVLREDCYNEIEEQSLLRVMKYSSSGTMLWGNNYEDFWSVLNRPTGYHDVNTIHIRRQSTDEYMIFVGLSNKSSCSKVGGYLKISNSGSLLASNYFIGNNETGVPYQLVNAASSNSYIVAGYFDGNVTGCGECGKSAAITDKISTTARLGEAQDEQSSSYIVAPNPTATYFSITPENNEIIENVLLYNLQGQLIQDYSESYSKINTSELQNATYILRVKSNGEWTDKKIIVNH